MPEPRYRYYNQQAPLIGPWGESAGTRLIVRESSVRYLSERNPLTGKLQLVSHPHTRESAYCESFEADPRAVNALNRDIAPPGHCNGYSTAMARLESESYARLRGRLYKGSASLGISLAQWDQSADIISKRYSQLSDLANRRFYFLKAKHRLLQRLTPRDLANFHLEVIFGWMPLLQDIHAAANTVIQQRVPDAFVRGSASATLRDFKDFGWYHEHFAVDVRVNRVARVRVSNPNSWLAERAGISNIFAIAWDAVPWSFVVNQFVNVGQLVSSLSDFYGLEFPDSSITRATRYTYRHILQHPDISWFSGSATYRGSLKYRDLGGVEPPPLVLRSPSVSCGSLAMAASLFIQKFRRVDGLF